MKILLIDDMDTYIQKFEAFAKVNNFKLDVLEGLIEFDASQPSRFEDIDLVLLDEHLPDCYGKELFTDSLIPKIEAGLFPKLKMVLGNSSSPRKQEYINEYDGKFSKIKFMNVGKAGMFEYLLNAKA